MGGDVGFVIPTFDVVFQFLFFGHQRGFLSFEAIEFGKVQRIGVKRGNQLNGAKSHDKQGNEKCDWSRTVFLSGRCFAGFTDFARFTGLAGAERLAHDTRKYPSHST